MHHLSAAYFRLFSLEQSGLDSFVNSLNNYGILIRSNIFQSMLCKLFQEKIYKILISPNTETTKTFILYNLA